jgi:serine/threonine protein phosphatase 1
VALLGNHEQMMLEARLGGEKYADWLRYGGDATLASYAKDGTRGKLSDVPDEHWEFLERSCVDYYETPTHFFVHAAAYPNVPLSEQPVSMLRWEAFDNPQPHESGRIMVCGHTPQRTGRPRNLGHSICLDTWAHGGGWLSGLDISSGQLWQANQQGDCKVGWIKEYEEDIDPSGQSGR